MWKSSVAVGIANRTGSPIADAEIMAKLLSDHGIYSLASLSLLDQIKLIKICPRISRFEAENILLGNDSWEHAWFQQMRITAGPAVLHSMTNTGHFCSQALSEAT